MEDTKGEARERIKHSQDAYVHGQEIELEHVPMKQRLNRCGKSCRLRWINYLRPDLKHEDFTPQEEELIFQLHEAIGSRWSLIAKQLPGRTDNDVKNYWNTKLKKKLSKMGIDPITHKPISKILSDYESIRSTCLTTTHPLKSLNETSSYSDVSSLNNFSRIPCPYNSTIQPMNLHQYISEEVSPSSSSSRTSSSKLLGSEQSPGAVLVPSWGDPSFGDNVPNAEMEGKCNFKKFLERDSEGHVQDMTDTSGLPVSSFVKSLLDSESEMQSDFPAFDDILDY